MLRKAFVVTLALFLSVGFVQARTKIVNPMAQPFKGSQLPLIKNLNHESPNPENVIRAPERPPRRDPIGPEGLVSQGDDFIIGYTYYDYQANGSVRKQIVRDSYGGVHFLWMNGYFQNIGLDRHMTYNYLHYLDINGDVDEGELLTTPDRPLPLDQWSRTGYGHLATYTSDPDDEFLDDIAIAFFHATGYEGAPDEVSPATAVGLDFQRSADENYHRLAYWRGDYDDQNFAWNWPEFPQTVDISSVISQIVATSSSSDKVALVWHHNRVGIPDPEGPWLDALGLYQRNSDIYYAMSDDGEEWDFDNDVVNITKIIPPRAEIWDYDREEGYGDTLRPYCDLDFAFDPWGDDELYGTFATVNFKEYARADDDGSIGGVHPEMGDLWFYTRHPDTGVDTLTLITDGHYFNRTNNQGGNHISRAGGWRVNNDRGSLAFNPEVEGTMYVVWCKFPHIQNYDAENDGWIFFDEEAAKDTSVLGYIAADIMLSISTDYGITWQEPINLTDTHWEGDAPPDPENGELHWSENWPSVASLADDTLHIMYVRDGYAGGTPQFGPNFSEGPATYNPVIYHRVALDDIDHDGDIYEGPEGFIFHNYLDLRPFPINSERTPGAPTPTDDVVVNVNVEVRGEQELRVVEVIYVIDGDINAERTVSMALVDENENLFEGTIPAMGEDTEIWYKIRAENEMGFDKVIPDDGSWYSYTSTENLTIKHVQQIPDRWRNLLDFSGYRSYEVTLTGVISTPASFANVFGAYAMQDDAAHWSGIFLRGIDDDLEIGQEITVTGTVMERDPETTDQWEYATYIQVDDYDLIGDVGNPPLSIPVDVVDLRFSTLAEELEGLSVAVVNFTIDSILTTESDKGFWPIFDISVNLEDGEIGWISSNGLSEQDAEEANLVIDEIVWGTEFTYIKGIFTESWGHYAITPHTVGDVGPHSVNENGNTSPYTFTLNPAFPNPFNAMTNISFELPRRGWTKLAVYDLAGRVVANVLEGEINQGRHNLTIDASSLSTGVYILRLETTKNTASQKLVLVK